MSWISYPELEDVIGEVNARALCVHCIGRLHWLPVDPGPDHPFAPIIGMEALTALAQHTGGRKIELPTLRTWNAAKSRICRMLDSGMDHATIAVKCGVSQRWVRRLAAQRPQRQLRLPIAVE